MGNRVPRAMMAVAFLAAVALCSPLPARAGVYTTTADFSSGTLLNLDPTNDQLQLITPASAGTWLFTEDSAATGTAWGMLRWNGSTPSGTSITVEARSSNDGSFWSYWETASNCILLRANPPGRYLQVRVTLGSADPAISPILYDLSVIQAKTKNTVFSVYPGASNISAGRTAYSPPGGDPISAVPGVLSFVSGNQWSNYVRAGMSGVAYQIKNVVLKKQVPQFLQCADVVIARTMYQHGSANIRRWWPLMYEAAGTTWELTIYYGTPTAWDDDGIGPHVRGYVHKEVWQWTLAADLDSLQRSLVLFHELPFGLDEVPLISDEVLYPKLIAMVEDVKDYVAYFDTFDAALALGDFEMEIMDYCIATSPSDPRPTGLGTGIANTVENPVCCKLLTDCEYIGTTTGIMQAAK